MKALERDRQLLKELADSPLAAEAARLDSELTALFVRLPGDEADTKLMNVRR
jgi:hypothetical protein